MSSPEKSTEEIQHDILKTQAKIAELQLKWAIHIDETMEKIQRKIEHLEKVTPEEWKFVIYRMLKGIGDQIYELREELPSSFPVPADDDEQFPDE